MNSQKNVLRLFIGKSVAQTADTTLIDSYSDLTDGAIAIVDLNNKVHTDISDLAVCRFVTRQGTQLFYSPFIRLSNITATATRSYSAGTEQVSFYGHNGTSGSITAANSTNYIMRLMLIDNMKMTRNQNVFKFGQYTSDASATQTEIADGLYDNLLQNFDKEVDQLRFERTAAGASLAAFTGSATIYKFTKNSTTVNTYTKAAAGNATLTASTASVTAEDLIQTPSTTSRSYTFSAVALGSTAGSHVLYLGDTSYYLADAGTDAQNATAIVAAINAGTQATASASTAAVTIILRDGVSAPLTVLSSDDNITFANVAVTNSDTCPIVYKAAATTSAAATFELDYAWQGPTCYFYEGTTVGKQAGVITATGNYGIKVSAEPRTNFTAGTWKYFKQRFKLSVVYGSTPTVESSITYSKVAAEGNGGWRQIAELEYFANGNEQSYGDRIVYPGHPALRTEVDNTKVYEILVLRYTDAEFTNIVGQTPGSLGEIMLAFEKDSAQGDALITTLNTGLATTLDFAAFS
jgi:hypothetical protein